LAHNLPPQVDEVEHTTINNTVIDSKKNEKDPDHDPPTKDEV